MKSTLKTTHSLTAALIAFGALVGGANAAIITNYSSRPSFESSSGLVSTITFSEFAAGTTITNQYSSMGVVFTGSDDQVVPSSYFDDGMGLSGGPTIDLAFTHQLFEIGCNFSGALHIELFDGATSIGSSSNFGGVGSGFFGGVTSDTGFNRVVITDYTDNSVYIDNLSFTSVPESSSALLLGLGIAAILGRRHRIE